MKNRKKAVFLKKTIESSTISQWLVSRYFCNSHFPLGNLCTVAFPRHWSELVLPLGFLPWWKRWNSLSDTLPQQIFSWGWAETGHRKSWRCDTHRPGSWGKYSTIPQIGPQSCCLLIPGSTSTFKLAQSSSLNSGSSRRTLPREVERELDHWLGLVVPSGLTVTWGASELLSILLAVSREGGNVFMEDSLEWSRIHSFTGVRVPEGTYVCKGFCELLGSAFSGHLLREVPLRTEVPKRPSAAQTL